MMESTDSMIRTKKGYAWSSEHKYNVIITGIAISQTYNISMCWFPPLYSGRKTTGYLEVQYC